MSKNEDLNESVTASTDSLLKRARQVSGNNLQGQVKIVSQAELNILIKDMVAANAGADEAELQALRQQWEQEEAARVQKLQEKHEETERALQEEIRQMQMKLANAESSQKEAIDSANAAANAKIQELQHIIDSDDARARLAFWKKKSPACKPWSIATRKAWKPSPQSTYQNWPTKKVAPSPWQEKPVVI